MVPFAEKGGEEQGMPCACGQDGGRQDGGYGMGWDELGGTVGPSQGGCVQEVAGNTEG